jgi:DNA replication protein DnaC
VSKTIGKAVETIFGPRPTADGDGYEFNIMFHEFYLDTHESYQAWWRGLDDMERARYERHLAEQSERERAAIEEENRRTAVLAERDRERARIAPYMRMRRRGVPAKDHDAIARAELEDTAAMQAVRALLASDQRILVLSGPKGCGKTTAAAWMVAQDISVRMPGGGEEGRAPEPQFLDVSKLARLSRYKAEEVEPIEECSLLVIDDLGMEYADEKGSFLATLDGVFNARYAAGLYTVITTNLPSKTFKERYGERLADRIREAGRFVELNGKSLRGRKP